MAKEDKIALRTLVKRLMTMEIRGRPLARRMLPKVVIKARRPLLHRQEQGRDYQPESQIAQYLKD